MHLRVIPAVGRINTLLLFIADWWPVVQMFHGMSINSLVEVDVGCVQIWAIMHKATIHGQVFL